MTRHTTQRSRASWPVFRCGERSTSLRVETQTVAFSPKTDPGLDLNHPQVWWPVGMGAHPLYSLQMAATVDDAISDQASTTFGIRSVSSHLTPQGYHQFVINGKPVLIRGAGWAPDMFLRDDPKRMEAEFSYVVNLGLNTHSQRGQAGGRTLLRLWPTARAS